jgi:hypothetical protein
MVHGAPHGPHGQRRAAAWTRQRLNLRRRTLAAGLMTTPRMRADSSAAARRNSTISPRRAPVRSRYNRASQSRRRRAQVDESGALLIPILKRKLAFDAAIARLGDGGHRERRLVPRKPIAQVDRGKRRQRIGRKASVTAYWLCASDSQALPPWFNMTCHSFQEPSS